MTLVARTEAKLTEIVGELGASRAEAFPLDVTDRAGLSALPGRVIERFGRLDIVVNNAGVNHRGALGKRSGAEINAILETNLAAPIHLAQTSIRYLGRDSVIVNIASLA